MTRNVKSQLTEFVRRVLAEQDTRPIPGDVPGNEQVHIFDFDDTLGITSNANGIMLYADGKPAWQSPDDVRSWMSKAGISADSILPPGIKKIDDRDGYSVYLTSSGLAKAQTFVPKERQGVVYQSTEQQALGPGEGLLLDFSPAGSTDIDTTKPIDDVIGTLKQANTQGSDTIVITARKATGALRDFEGKDVNATNAKDMTDFLAQYGATPNRGVLGVTGKNKGNEIINQFFSGDDPPEEVHFYDDLKKNTDEVEAAVGGKVPSELFVYGPGEFDHGEADPHIPNKAFPPKKSKNESVSRNTVLERWARIAGIPE